MPDFEAIVANLRDDAFKDFAWFAYYTGMRKTQTAMLTWNMVDADGKVLRVPGPLTKNRKPHLMPLVGPLAEIMERRRTARVVESEGGGTGISKWIFHREGFPVVYKSFFTAWDAARKAAGLPNALFHDLRRTAVRNMVRAGVPEAVAMKISGHRTRSIFDRYNIIDERDIAEGLERTFDHISRSAAAGRKIQTIDRNKTETKPVTG